MLVQGQPPPPPPPEGEKEGERAEDKKQKENTAYAKKMVLRLAGLMGVGGAVSIVYIFGECFRLGVFSASFCQRRELLQSVVREQEPEYGAQLGSILFETQFFFLWPKKIKCPKLVAIPK